MPCVKPSRPPRPWRKTEAASTRGQPRSDAAVRRESTAMRSAQAVSASAMVHPRGAQLLWDAMGEHVFRNFRNFRRGTGIGGSRSDPKKKKAWEHFCGRLRKLRKLRTKRYRTRFPASGNRMNAANFRRCVANDCESSLPLARTSSRLGLRTSALHRTLSLIRLGLSRAGRAGGSDVRKSNAARTSLHPGKGRGRGQLSQAACERLRKSAAVSVGVEEVAWD